MMKRKTNIFLLLLIALAMSSCLTSKKVNLLQEPDGKKIPSYVDTLSFEDYRIRIDDRLYIQVYSVDESINKIFNQGQSGSYMRQQMRQGYTDAYGNNELYSYLVDDIGNIQYPLIVDVPVRGKTTREVKQMLEEQLAGLVKEK